MVHDFVEKGGICEDEIEGLELAVRLLEAGAAVPDVRRRAGALVQDHVHLREGGGRVVHFLAVEREVEPGGALGLVVRPQEQGAGAAGRIANGLVRGFRRADTDRPGHDAGHFGGSVELALALARFGREVPHQVFVGVAEQIVAVGAVAAEIESLEDGHELGEAIHHVLGFAELGGVVEIGDVDDALKLVGVGELIDGDVDLIAYLLVALQSREIGEAAARRDGDQAVLRAGIFIRDVFDEQQDQHVVLVLRGIHSAAEFVAALPEGGVKFGFLESHSTERSRLKQDACEASTLLCPIWAAHVACFAMRSIVLRGRIHWRVRSVRCELFSAEKSLSKVCTMRTSGASGMESDAATLCAEVGVDPRSAETWTNAQKSGRRRGPCGSRILDSLT